MAVKSVNGSLTTDGTMFVFSDFAKQLNKNFATTDKTGYGTMTNEQVWQLAVNAYKKATTEVEKQLYKAIYDYCYYLATKDLTNDQKIKGQQGTGKLIRNVDLKEIYKAMAKADGVESSWDLIISELGGYSSKYPEAYASLMVAINRANEGEGEEIDKQAEVESAAKTIAEKKLAESMEDFQTSTTTTTLEESTSTAGTSWLMIAAAVGLGFALLFGGGDKKKKKKY